MSDGARIRTILLEDHKMVRQGLVALLQDAPDIEIVAEAGDGRTAVGLAETHQPDVALLDISMPGMNGLEAAQRIRQVSPGTKLLFLTMYADDEYIIQALRFGGTGYVLKDADAGTLIEAVRRVNRGESYLSPEVSQTIIRRVVNDMPEPAGDVHENLTTRERQILQLIAESRTNREIGERLRISIKTVQTHRANLMNKLDIHDQTTLVKYAIRHGLVRLE
jgi:DNA-binding NarL/FixJ family response regulator